MPNFNYDTFVNTRKAFETSIKENRDLRYLSEETKDALTRLLTAYNKLIAFNKAKDELLTKKQNQKI